MAFNPVLNDFDNDLNIIQLLDDEPNDVGGLSSAELKAKFDEAGNTIKEWLNGEHIPELLEQLLAVYDAGADYTYEMSGSALEAAEAYTDEQVAAESARTDEALYEFAAAATEYTDEQTAAAERRANDYTDQKVVDIGAADMQKNTYDPQRRETDIFAALDGKAPTLYIKATDDFTTDDLPNGSWGGVY